MAEAIKMFQTLDSNSKIPLIILKRNLSYVMKKWMFMFIKYLKILRGHNRLEAITLI